MSDWYDRQGNLVSMLGAAQLSEDPNYRVVRQQLVGPWFVSTVWLGLDFRWGEGPPLIFETMVFRRGQWGEDYCDRYSTEAEAERGHAVAVRRYRWPHRQVRGWWLIGMRALHDWWLRLREWRERR